MDFYHEESTTKVKHSTNESTTQQLAKHSGTTDHSIVGIVGMLSIRRET
jgi:hypothetical protein